jgi:UDP-N-acetylmuramate--alanine ligase
MHRLSTHWTSAARDGIGPIHFIGVGGIGMSGIAEIMHNLGYRVQGSDIADNYNTQRLRDMGVKIWTTHSAAHIDGASVVVISSAIKQDNPELMIAREQRVPVVRRCLRSCSRR